MSMEKQYHHELGFTLFELLITMSLSILLLLIAVPSYQDFQRGILEELVILQLSEDFKLAKNLANIEGRAITICGSADGQYCISAEEYHWPGWILFYDADASFHPQTENIIHYYAHSDIQPSGLVIQSTRNIGGGINIQPRRQYAYGMARSLPNGRINLCQRSKGRASQYTSIVINVYAYSRLEKKSGIC